MIRYSLDLDINKSIKQLNYNDSIQFLGSCFSDHISKQLKLAGFNVNDSVNGVVFNPISLVEPLLRLIQPQPYTEDSICFNNGLYYSDFHHGVFASPDQSVLLNQINNNQTEFATQLAQCKFLFITFGSAYVYKRVENNRLVANCHKQASNSFNKALLSVSEIVDCYEPILHYLEEKFPQLSVVFTVSPVKHLRDGVVENQWSKATLLLAIHQLLNKSNVTYFPSYELLNDDLRDYRFYESDGAHPNQLAIDYIFDKFKDVFFDDKTVQYFEEAIKLSKLKNHIPIHKHGEEYQKWILKTEKMESVFKTKYQL
jgi:hypothetical protein